MNRKIDDPAEAGRRMRQLRGIRTKTGVARELGIPYSTYCAYESGTRCPPAEARERIAGYFGVDPDSIFCTHKNNQMS